MASTTVNFNLKTAGYVNYANQTLTFRLLTAGAEAATGDQSYVTLPGVVTATSAANGDGSVTLFRNGKSGINSIYEVILPNREKAKFLIPSGSATIELATLLVDHVPGGSDTQQSSVYAEAIKRANHTGQVTLATAISDAATVQLKPSEGAFVNGDKTKLTNIETGATADQTNAEIRAAVEAATNSNVFTDDDHTKLDNIAVSTVESVQDIAGGLVAAGGTKTGIAITYDDANNNMDFVVASQTDQNFTTADHDKLDGIEPSADVTDTTNVRGADALMDDELTDLAGVKGVTISTLQVKPSEGAFVDGDKTKLDNMAGTSVEAVQDIAGALVATGGTKTGIAVTYDDANANMDFVVTFPSQTDQNFTTADHNKLDGIEPSATADQTASEIRTLVESATDSNVFTDVDHTKLNGIETGSKVQVNFVPRSISFTNASSFLSVANDGDLNVGTNDFSFSFSARVSSDSNAPVLQKNGSAGYALFFDTGVLKLTLNADSTSSNFSLASGLNDNKWHTYVITVDRDGNAIAYVDNVAQAGVPVSGKAGNLDNTSNLQIGFVGTIVGSGIALGNYVSLHKTVLASAVASNIYFSPDTALGAGSTELMVDLRKADKTFTDVSTNGFAVTTNGTIIFNEGRITSLDGATVGATTPAAVTGTNVLATTTLGYKAGSGGTVTQAATGKGTAVALNKISGEIVMDDASLANDATAVFTFNNTTIAATDVVIVNIASGVAVAGSYQVTVGAVATNSCSISVLNVSGGARTDTIKLNFAVIKAVKT